MASVAAAASTMTALEQDALDQLVDQEKKFHKKTDFGPPPVPPKEKVVYKKVSTSLGYQSFFDTVAIIPRLPDFLFRVYIPSDWPEDMRPFIPEFDPAYVPQTEELYKLLLAWEQKDNTLLFGPTGSGKTTMVQYACALTGRPFFRCLGRADLESGPIWGQLDVDGSGTRWNDGILTEAAKGGAVILWDEPFVCPAGIQIGAHSLLEDNPTLILTDKPGTLAEKMVVPHHRMRIVYADNTGGLGDDMGSFAGVQVQNTATLDRFQTVINLQYLSVDHETKILSEKVEGLDTLDDKTFPSKLIQFASLVRTNYMEGELSLTMSPRSLVSVAQKCVFYKGDIKEAFESGFLRKFSDAEEKATVEAHVSTVFGVEAARGNGDER